MLITSNEDDKTSDLINAILIHSEIKKHITPDDKIITYRSLTLRTPVFHNYCHATNDALFQTYLQLKELFERKENENL